MSNRRKIKASEERPAYLDDPRFPAAAALLGHTGAQEVQIRFCEEQMPVLWMACGRWDGHWEASGAMDPLLALFRLCDQVIDGGECTHCHRPTGFVPELDSMPVSDLICWYQWDPSRRKFQRGCLGEAP